MAFAPENPLEDLMRRAAHDVSVRPQFYSLLMQSPLLVLGRVTGHTAQDEILPLLNDRRFELFQLSAKGRPYHAAFTAMSRLQAFNNAPESYFTAIGRTLFENTRGAGYLLNYGSEVGKELLPEEIEYALNPKAWRPAPAARNQIAVGQPDPYPGKLTGALGILFLNRSQVVCAHLVEALISEREPPHLLIGLVAHGNPRRIIAEIGEVAAALNVSGIVDVMVLDPANARSELQAALLATPPFYDRPITPQSQSPQSKE